MINGISLTSLKIIQVPGGDVLHAMKKSDPGFGGFGEAYFSTIHNGQIKAWKRHRQMTTNLVVPVGKVKFVVFDDRQDSSTIGNFFEVVLSPDNYQRLTICPGLWFGFAGLASPLSLILNLADIEHDPAEGETITLGKIDYQW